MTTNHSGWCVEIYNEALGWEPVSVTFETEAQAEKLKVFMKRIVESDEFRVYEVLV